MGLHIQFNKILMSIYKLKIHRFFANIKCGYYICVDANTHKVYAYSGEKIHGFSRDALGLASHQVKNCFGTKKDKYTSDFSHCTIICFEQFAPPHTVIRHYTIIKFDRFATIYCYLAYTFIWQSRVWLKTLSGMVNFFESSWHS